MNRFLIVLLCLTVAPLARADKPVTFDRAMAADGEVKITNVAGSVRVVGWGRNEIKVTGTAGEDVERVEFAGDERRTEIKVILPKRSNCCKEGSAELVINVPKGVSLDVSTVSADIGIDSVEGQQRLNSVSGDIDYRGGARDIAVKTVSGELVLHGTGTGQGVRLDARSVSGNVSVDGLEGELRAGSTSGDIRVTAKRLGRLEIENTSGDIIVRGALTPAGSYELQTVSGDVRFAMEGEREGVFDISTFSGDIDNRFGPEPRRTSEYGPGMELRFSAGKGGARVRITTLSGKVVLE